MADKTTVYRNPKRQSLASRIKLFFQERKNLIIKMICIFVCCLALICYYALLCAGVYFFITARSIVSLKNIAYSFTLMTCFLIAIMFFVLASPEIFIEILQKWYKKTLRENSDLLQNPDETTDGSSTNLVSSPKESETPESRRSSIERGSQKSTQEKISTADLDQLSIEHTSQILELDEQQQSRQDIKIKPKSRTQKIALEEELVLFYNQAADNQSERQAFKERYSPIRFGIQNLMQRREDFSIDPIYQTANDGDYLAIKLDGLPPDEYLVVPRFDLTFQESVYGPGAMGKVFNCTSYDSQSRYHRVRVIQVAVFESVDSQNWFWKEKGELKLGQAE